MFVVKNQNGSYFGYTGGRNSKTHRPVRGFIPYINAARTFSSPRQARRAFDIAYGANSGHSITVVQIEEKTTRREIGEAVTA